MSLRDQLDRIADDAPAVGDVADRALRGAQRHRRRVQLPIAAAAAVIAIALIGGAILRPNLLGLDFAPAQEWDEQTVIPTTAQALPAKGVGPARLAYLWNCSTDGANPKDCLEARVMTPDNKHWIVREARPRLGPEGEPTDPAITLSPDGKRLVYTDGTKFVLRDLASGATTDLVTVNGADNLYDHMAWSPDSRWLALSFLGEDAQRSTLIDLSTKKVTPLRGWPIGLPNGAAVMPFTDVGRMDEGMVIPIRDRSGASKGTISTSVLGAPGPFTPDGMVSPDGDTVALVFAPSANSSPKITVVGVNPPKGIDQVTFGSGSSPLAYPYVLGWPDDSRFLYVTHWVEKAWTLPTRHTLELYDVESGKTRRLTELVGNAQVGTLSVATDLL